MAKKSVVAPAVIRLRGVRHNNLKNFDLDLPQNQLIVITGLSGSGKSSLAFDTLFAEGQRRYIETFSPYARQFFDRMDKPQVDSIEGIPPAIAIEQRNSVKTTRSTVGTMTELCDYMKLLWPHVSQLYCRQCHQPVRKDPPQRIWETLSAEQKTRDNGAKVDEVLVTFALPISEKLSLDESLALISKQGYQRLLVNNKVVRLEEATDLLRRVKPETVTVIQDRVKIARENRARFVEACEQAYHFGKGKLSLHYVTAESTDTQHAIRHIRPFSNKLHCATCDIDYKESSTALFSFNHPIGACPTCRGFGRTITIDYDLALPDKTKTLAEGAVKPWQTGQGAESQADLMKFCRTRRVPTDVRFKDLPAGFQDWVINGDKDYGKDSMHEWPRAWYGIKGYFRWLESKAYKMHVRVLLSRYRSYVLCPDCHGQRFQAETLLYKVQSKFSPRNAPSNGSSQTSLITLSDFYRLPLRDALAFIEELSTRHNVKPSSPLGLIFNEVRARLGYLNNVGLGYLTLDRPTRSLSGGETERVNLTTCLGTRLVNTLFVLDEPSVGLHPRDTGRLVNILEQLRNAGNTVVVVEHEASVMRAADQIIDIGPGHGATGGQVVFQGSYTDILKSPVSLTGQYLSGTRDIPLPQRRHVRLETKGAKPTRNGRGQAAAEPAKTSFLTLAHAIQHNLQDLTVRIPLERFVCITGVSGSGKTTLAREVLLPLLSSSLNEPESSPSESEDNEETEHATRNTQLGNGHTPTLTGSESLGRVVLVDQSILGKTPRSNPAVYIGAFDDIRDVFAQSELARQRGLNSSAFSFNSGQGQCERCRGAGFEKIEMQFLSDVFIKCPECNGRRYRPHILEIKVQPPLVSSNAANADSRSREMSIADLLDATVDEAVDFLSQFLDSKAASRAAQSLKLLQDVGLGYLRVGQPINTLSGGESQRLKLVRHLAEFSHSSAGDTKPTLFLFDEPTTGLHFDDVRVLLKVFQRLVDARHSVVIIEHNLDVIKSADWVIDLGPDAGDRGGEIVAEGTPEEVAACAKSHTGQALKAELAGEHPG
ncbi:excinuclease ABC, A subunit [Pedosphaera parvula Ellin514]|uniref:UvrABC system protein A n=1 Tax=Pedosphaera parvula (strain Ellin514) TaxID=320771 RepID=B9XQK9_PEDPL|nr:excinuclease ABC subunit UvrA [Pedosphaera parvula]EEF57859.1 excinuclease ABC, A subunit [Pedosphaera parvula Ellin514]